MTKVVGNLYKTAIRSGAALELGFYKSAIRSWAALEPEFSGESLTSASVVCVFIMGSEVSKVRLEGSLEDLLKANGTPLKANCF